MREIKFRAWNPLKKEMKQLTLLGLIWAHDTDLTVYGIRNAYDDVAYSVRDEIPVMQYTGLKDKNGVEIYEGDIMLTNDMYHDYEDGVAINALPDGKFVEVKWESGAFFTGDEMLSEMAPYYEIIGNIYQNPELLKN